MVHHLSLRERNRERTEQEIEAAAMALFAARGFDGTTVEQIAAAAGVSPRTFFRYFPAKEDVVFRDHATAVARLRAALAATDPHEPPLRRVRRAVLAVQAPGRHPDMEVARARLVSEVPALRARFYNLAEEFEAAVAEVLVEDLGQDDDALARAAIITGAVFGALRGARRAAAMLTHPDPQRLVETAFHVVEEGADKHLPPHSTRCPRANGSGANGSAVEDRPDPTSRHRCHGASSV
ncbi:MAG: TetR family transcriptional regulator [Chloroflexota bacterium]|nr:TetR family transcriptional regulator [Chloroflexota bacterium]